MKNYVKEGQKLPLFGIGPYLVLPFVNWGIMTIVLKNTEEKWLRDLYGEGYITYKKRVNRCIPWNSGVKETACK